MIDNQELRDSILKSVGYGESKPIVSNLSNLGRKKNRRTEVKIL